MPAFPAKVGENHMVLQLFQPNSEKRPIFQLFQLFQLFQPQSRHHAKSDYPQRIKKEATKKQGSEHGLVRMRPKSKHGKEAQSRHGKGPQDIPLRMWMDDIKEWTNIKLPNDPLFDQWGFSSPMPSVVSPQHPV